MYSRGPSADLQCSFSVQPSFLWYSALRIRAAYVSPYSALSPQLRMWLGSAWISPSFYHSLEALKAYVNGNCRSYLICFHCLGSIFWYHLESHYHLLFSVFFFQLNVVPFTPSWLEAMTGNMLVAHVRASCWGIRSSTWSLNFLFWTMTADGPETFSTSMTVMCCEE